MLTELQATAPTNERFLPESAPSQRKMQHESAAGAAAEAAAELAARIEQERTLRRGLPPTAGPSAGPSDTLHPLFLRKHMLLMEKAFAAHSLQIGSMGQYEREMIECCIGRSEKAVG